MAIKRESSKRKKFVAKKVEGEEGEDNPPVSWLSSGALVIATDRLLSGKPVVEQVKQYSHGIRSFYDTEFSEIRES